MGIKGLAVVAAYLIGAIPFALVVGKGLRGVDIRQHGSGNLGTTNAFRTLGKQVGILVLVGDIAKGSLAAGLGLWAGGPQWGILTGLVAVVGHVFPVYARFHGGKGIATGAGAFVVLFPQAFLIGALLFVSTLLLTRYVSLSSLLGALGIGTGGLILGYDPLALGAIWLVVVFVFFTHRANIRRLLRGEERKANLFSKK